MWFSGKKCFFYIFIFVLILKICFFLMKNIDFLFILGDLFAWIHMTWKAPFFSSFLLISDDFFILNLHCHKWYFQVSNLRTTYTLFPNKTERLYCWYYRKNRAIWALKSAKSPSPSEKTNLFFSPVHFSVWLEMTYMVT